MKDHPHLTLIQGEGLDGLCPRCGAHPLLPGNRICIPCSDRLGKEMGQRADSSAGRR